MSGQLHASAALLSGIDLPVPSGKEAVSHRASLDDTEKRKISCPCRESNPCCLSRSPLLYPVSYRCSHPYIYKVKKIKLSL
jgi:hypothetical protein